jgi:hypothetical protein
MSMPPSPVLCVATVRGHPATRLPPFGKALQDRGPGLVLIVPNTADGWRTVNVHPRGDVLIYQLGHDPGLYHWPVQDCEVVLYTECFDPTTTKRAVDMLTRAGAAVVSCHAGRGTARVIA